MSRAVRADRTRLVLPVVQVLSPESEHREIVKRVWAAGFEPAFSRTRNERSSQLSHAQRNVSCVICGSNAARAPYQRAQGNQPVMTRVRECQRQNSNPHCPGFEAVASCLLGYAGAGAEREDRFGVDAVHGERRAKRSRPSPRSACGAGVLTRGRAPRGLRRKDSNLRRCDSKSRILAAGPLRIVGRSLRMDSHHHAWAYEAQLPLGTQR